MILTSSATSFFLQLLVGTSQAIENSLRGYYKESLSKNFYSSDGQELEGGLLTSFHRGLQESVVVIPVLPIVIIIILICCLRNKQNQPTQQQATPATPTMEVVNRGQPKLVTASATKISSDALVGVSFVAGTDYAEISRINHNSIFRNTELLPGMKVVSINNISINTGAHAKQVIAASKSFVTMLAHTAGYFGNTENFVTATACKEQPDQKVGVVYQKEDGSGRILLKRMTVTSMFANGDLSPGMEVVAINGVTVLSAVHAKILSVEAFPILTILARRSKAVAVVVDPSDDIPVATATVMAVQ